MHHTLLYLTTASSWPFRASRKVRDQIKKQVVSAAVAAGCTEQRILLAPKYR
jgi:hypothetical protein